jgi:hypothetical protein
MIKEAIGIEREPLQIVFHLGEVESLVQIESLNHSGTIQAVSRGNNICRDYDRGKQQGARRQYRA